MRPWNKTVWRSAVRIAESYQTHNRIEPGCLPEREWNEATSSLGAWGKSQSRGWDRAAVRQRTIWIESVRRLRERLDGTLSAMNHFLRAWSPNAEVIYEELLAIADEFDVWSCRVQELSVTTEHVALEGIELGRFEIRLDLTRLGASEPFRVVALDPNPAAASSDTVHPHVHNSKLCAGEGRPAIAAALREGRLHDFFVIVSRILNTYAEGSAYTELVNWSGVPCHDCDTSVEPEDAYSCQTCDETVCGDCQTGCAQCCESFCSQCIGRCPQCEESTCSGCLTSCSACDQELCESCLTEGMCHACWEQLQDAEEEEESESQTSAEVHADGLGQAPLST